MIINGKIHKFGDDINTDLIIPARRCNAGDEKALAVYCMEDIRKDFYKCTADGDVIVAGENFGCGSSREMAVTALIGCGIKCVVAKSFARIFFRNAINLGLHLIECSELYEDVAENESLTVDTEKGTVTYNRKVYRATLRAKGAIAEEIIKYGGLMPYLKEKML